MKYNTFRYIYPPRPENCIPPTELDFWDDNSLIAQLKFNGSNCLIFTDGVKCLVMNRHNQRLTNFNLTESEVRGIHRGSGWMVINGEYMNKNKNDENGQPFNHKLVIFDILVLNGEYLIGKTFIERVELLDSLYGKVDSDKEYLYSISDNIYRVKTYFSKFKDIFFEYTKIDMIEGLVMKRKLARLERGNTEMNNVKSQVKCRKSTLNYKY